MQLFIIIDLAIRYSARICVNNSAPSSCFRNSLLEHVFHLSTIDISGFRRLSRYRFLILYTDILMIYPADTCTMFFANIPFLFVGYSTSCVKQNMWFKYRKDLAIGPVVVMDLWVVDWLAFQFVCSCCEYSEHDQYQNDKTQSDQKCQSRTHREWCYQNKIRSMKTDCTTEDKLLIWITKYPGSVSICQTVLKSAMVTANPGRS